jgi:hypothetical protein
LPEGSPAPLFLAELGTGATNGGLHEGGETIAHDQDSRLELLAVSQWLPAGFDVGSRGVGLFFPSWTPSADPIACANVGAGNFCNY